MPKGQNKSTKPQIDPSINPGTFGRYSNTAAATIETGSALIPGRLLAAGLKRDGFLLEVSAKRVKMHLEAPLALGVKVALALTGSVHCGGQVVWRHGMRHGIAFAEGLNQLPPTLIEKLPAHPTAADQI